MTGVIQILIVITILTFVFEVVYPYLRQLGEDIGALIIAPSREEYFKAPSSLDEAKTRIRRIRLVRMLAWFCLRGEEKKGVLEELTKLRYETGRFVVTELLKEFRMHMSSFASTATCGTWPMALAIMQTNLKKELKLIARIKDEARLVELMRRKMGRTGNLP